ncbi:hypothetical protein AB6A40_009666 [Gnathostoma spinigerum]|uniref:Maf-like protein n=1 Tax=Gnathostoma spinigerum TaxID=75299 RepID=A0ABD6F187_9BILA
MSSAMKIVLASGSPQRLALLKQIGIEPIVKVSGFDENFSKTCPVVEFVEKTAEKKALDVRSMMINEDYDVIIGCDTVVVLDNEIIGKPSDASDAVRTLKRLSGRVHEVYSGVALLQKNGGCEIFTEKTKVKFSELSLAVIENYVNSGEPLKCAGSYAIQGRGAILVEWIEGCFYNVVGLPLNRIIRKLRTIDVRTGEDALF